MQNSKFKMAAFTKAVRLSGVTNISKLFNNLSLSAKSSTILPSVSLIPRMSLQNSYATQAPPPDPLMEFFDDKKHWGEKNVKVGRSWKMDELRIKSNEDLHKLWYILLKERNMLMTMEHLYAQKWEPFPNPERRDKVEESMENLENVVRERNQAYHYLETGTHGERPIELVTNVFGLKEAHKMEQNLVPYDPQIHDKYQHLGYAVRKFLRKYREKVLLYKRKQQRADNATVRKIFRNFPNVDIEAVREKYPNVDVERVRRSRGSRRHYVPPESGDSL